MRTKRRSQQSIRVIYYLSREREKYLRLAIPGAISFFRFPISHNRPLTRSNEVIRLSVLYRTIDRCHGSHSPPRDPIRSNIS